MVRHAAVVVGERSADSGDFWSKHHHGARGLALVLADSGLDRLSGNYRLRQRVSAPVESPARGSSRDRRCAEFPGGRVLSPDLGAGGTLVAVTGAKLASAEIAAA